MPYSYLKKAFFLHFMWAFGCMWYVFYIQTLVYIHRPLTLCRLYMIKQI